MKKNPFPKYVILCAILLLSAIGVAIADVTYNESEPVKDTIIATGANIATVGSIAPAPNPTITITMKCYAGTTMEQSANATTDSSGDWNVVLNHPSPKWSCGDHTVQLWYNGTIQTVVQNEVAYSGGIAVKIQDSSCM